MTEKKEQFFHEITIESLKDSIVILDIDGTLACSSRWDVDFRVVNQICKLQKYSTVYIFSNNYNGVRSREIAHNLNIPYIESPYKKPNKKVLNYIEKSERKIIVIGDKYLTDELFARFTNSTYLRVKRYRCKNDSFADKAACIFDDCVRACARFLGVTQ